MRIIVSAVLAGMFLSGCRMDTQNYCVYENIEQGSCKRGDLLWAPAPKIILMYCDIDEGIITLGDGTAVCHYSGTERQRRPVDLLSGN